jgi:cytochrome c553
VAACAGALAIIRPAFAPENLPNCLRKMNKLMTTALSFVVASVTLGATFCAFAQDKQGDVKAGERKIAMCIGCHGIQGYQASFPEIYKVPKISGQSAKYIVSALNAYKAGERKHPTMIGIATSMTDQDMADVAAYYAVHGKTDAGLADQPSKEPSPQVAALLQKGACVSCHGANFAKPIDPAYPKIAGQHADYLYVALKAYKTENNPKMGRTNGVMAGIAKQYTNAELKALASYVSSLDGDLKTVADRKFR